MGEGFPAQRVEEIRQRDLQADRARVRAYRRINGRRLRAADRIPAPGLAAFASWVTIAPITARTTHS